MVPKGSILTSLWVAETLQFQSRGIASYPCGSGGSSLRLGMTRVHTFCKPDIHKYEWCATHTCAKARHPWWRAMSLSWTIFFFRLDQYFHGCTRQSIESEHNTHLPLKRRTTMVALEARWDGQRHLHHRYLSKFQARIPKAICPKQCGKENESAPTSPQTNG